MKKTFEEIKQMFKNPQEVANFLDDHFSFCALNPAIEGFSIFFETHKNVLPLILEHMDKKVIQRTREEIKKMAKRPKMVE